MRIALFRVGGCGICWLLLEWFAWFAVLGCYVGCFGFGGCICFGFASAFGVLIVVCWVLSGCLCLGLVDFVVCDWFSKLRLIGYGW